MNFIPEVLIYIQTVKTYFKNSEDAREYFIGNSSEEVFFQHLGEISQKNFETKGEVMLDKEQFELLRRTIAVITIVQQEFVDEDEITKEDKSYNPEENIFIDMRGYGKICLN
jgi:hypothetical protein